MVGKKGYIKSFPFTPKTEINYIPEKTSFLVNAIFSATATTIDAEGIVQLTCRE